MEGRGHASFPFKAAHSPGLSCVHPCLLPFSFAASLIGVEGGNATRIGRFANYLRNLLPSNDPVVMEMASKAIGRLAMAGDTFTAEYVEFEVKRALEWLGADRNEGRRHAAVSACGRSADSLPRAMAPYRDPSHNVLGLRGAESERGCSRHRHCFLVALHSVLNPFLSSP